MDSAGARTLTKTRSCSTLSSSSSSSSSSYSLLLPSLEEASSLCPPPPPPKAKKTMRKGTRSSTRLSIVPVIVQEEWRSLPTAPGSLRLARVAPPDTPDTSNTSTASTSSNTSTASHSSTMDSSTDTSLPASLNSSRGELGTRGLQRVGSRGRKQLLKQAGVEVDGSEGEQLRQLRVWRSRPNCGCDCRGPCLPDSCSCVQGGIGCHEEERREPCSCSAACSNPHGKYRSCSLARFDQTQVEMHLHLGE